MAALYSRLRACAALLLVGAALPAQAATILVTTNADELNNDGDCSLREAVQAANTNVGVDACLNGSTGGDTVLFTAIAGQTITLTAGQIEVTDGLTIGGPVAAVTIIAAPGARHFRLSLTSPVEPVALQNMTLRGGSGFIGGAVLVADNQPTAFTAVTFDQNTSGASGGALRVGAGVHLLENCTFTANTTTVAGVTDGGGALYNNGGDVTLVGNSFSGNTALAGTANGGAILNGFGGVLTVRDTGFSGNQAARAGGAIETVGALALNGSTFTSNSAGINGGAIHMTGAITATISGTSTFNLNTAAQEGGALWNSATGTLFVTGAQITNNTAAGPAADQGGGGVFSDGGITTLVNTTITGNAATGAAGSGGGVQNTAGGRLTITGGTVANNTSVRAGGGVEANQSGTATGNTTRIENVTISGNNAGTAPGFGGGVHLTGAAVVTVVGGTISGNTAAEGGGLWKAAAGTLTVTGTLIDNNTATGAAADQGGGGVYNDGDGGVLTLRDLTLSNNDATGAAGSGGGLLNNVGGTTVLRGVTVSGNTAVRAGGGIEDNAGMRLSFDRGTLTGNTTGAAPGNGGGLHITGAGTVAVDSSAVLSNTAANQGGGLWNAGTGTMTVTATTVRGNTVTGSAATSGGGGLYQQPGTTGVLTVERSLVADNAAAAATGGGVLVAGGQLVRIVNTTVSGNTAANGAGVAVGAAGVASLESATVAFNSASTAAGGLLSAGTGAFTLSNTLVSNNTAATGADCQGGFTTAAVNLVAVPAACVFTGPAPLTANATLAPLADNGGPTLTHALATGSPAARAGLTSLAVDQRGYTRQAQPSIGAFELGGQPVAGEGSPVASTAFSLSAAMPNPVRSAATLRVTVAASEPVAVALYDALGRRVATLYAGTPAAESTVDVRVEAGGLAPGVYVVRATSASATATTRLTVVR